MRRAITMVAILLALQAVQGRAAAADPVKQLGEAWAAYRTGDFAGALALAEPLLGASLKNPDYALYLAAEAAYLIGDRAKALPLFEQLGAQKGSRFADLAAWRAADCRWDLGQTATARKNYEALLGKGSGDEGVARYRIAEAMLATGDKKAAYAAWRKLAIADPAHPLADRALARLAAVGAAPLTAKERISRAASLTSGRGWTEALVELAYVGDDEPAAVLRLRDFWLGETLFKMRRQYPRAGELLIKVHADMGGMAAQALFHGARALSRANRDDEAIKWYAQVVAKYPKTDWAEEAQFLSGWLEYNRGQFKAAIPPLEALLAKYPRSKWADDALWFKAYCLYLLGEYDTALPILTKIGASGGELDAGKGRYWKGRSLWALGRTDEGDAELRDLVTRFPISWYAMLARARLAEKGIVIGPFGDSKKKGSSGPAFGAVDEKLTATDADLARVDELIAAGLGGEAGFELRRVEQELVGRYGSARAVPLLMDRYTKAGNFNRPWALASAYGGRALKLPPDGAAGTWWRYVYPEAYKAHVEKYQESGKNPPYYIYTIMLKESGFNPNDVSYADAIGLLQMIPPTTRRVVREVGLEYADDLLYDPELNIRVGAWYIGNLYAKFKSQIPIAAGSYNGGPKPVMRWLDTYGDRPIDEFVELCSYRESREYMKKVTAIYARYLYLYGGVDYQQPLTLDREYVKNELNY